MDTNHIPFMKPVQGSHFYTSFSTDEDFRVVMFQKYGGLVKNS